MPPTSPNAMQKLMQELPDRLKVELREAMDGLGLVNPQDEVFKLMIVLGVWAKYYQSIPAEMMAAGRMHEEQREKMLSSLDGRLEFLRQMAQAIQQAIDRLEGAPGAIVEKFPAESLARNIAAKINEQFRALPLVEAEKAVDELTRKLGVLVGEKDDRDKPGLLWETGQRLSRLERSMEEFNQSEAVRWKWRDLAMAFAGVALTLLLIWIGGCGPTKTPPVPGRSSSAVGN